MEPTPTSDNPSPTPEPHTHEHDAGAPVTPGPGDNATPPPSPETAEAARRSRDRTRLRAIALGSALVGMVFGAVVEMFVQGAMESTGWFGPTLDTLIAEQETNFKDLRSKLDALKASDDPAERDRLERELETLIVAQEKLASRAHVEIRDYQEQLQTLKAQVLAAGGGVSGADFWLEPGESAAVGERTNVLGVIGIPSTSAYVQVNFLGKRETLRPGDAIDITVADGTGKIIFKQVKEGRAGFDYVPPAK